MTLKGSACFGHPSEKFDEAPKHLRLVTMACKDSTPSTCLLKTIDSKKAFNLEAGAFSSVSCFKKNKTVPLCMEIGSPALATCCTSLPNCSLVSAVFEGPCCKKHPPRSEHVPQKMTYCAMPPAKALPWFPIVPAKESTCELRSPM